MRVASLSKCDNLFSRPRNRPLLAPPPLSGSPRRHRTVYYPLHRRRRRRLSPFRALTHPPRSSSTPPCYCARLAGLTLWHHYDVNERGVSILPEVAATCPLFPVASAARRRQSRPSNFPLAEMYSPGRRISHKLLPRSLNDHAFPRRSDFCPDSFRGEKESLLCCIR